MNLIIPIIIIGIGCLCVAVTIIIFGVYQVGVNKNVSALPISYQFNKKENSRLLGHKINTFNDVSEDDCLKKCYENPFCLGATYKIDKKICDLQYVNTETTPKFVAEWDSSSSYSRIDVTPGFEITENNQLNVSSVEQIPTKNAKDCAGACVRYVGNSSKDICLSANYDNSKGTCDILTETKYNNPAAYDSKTGITHIYRKGLVGGHCKAGLDCIFGWCKDNKCLTAFPAAAGEKCVQDYECSSGTCVKTEIPLEAREKQRQTLLKTDGTPGSDAKLCDKYKTQQDCEKTIIDKATSSAATCIWNSNVCFPKSIKRFTYICE